MYSNRDAGAVATNKLGMRRSCDRCGRRKKKCDRSMPCGRCEGAGHQCTYSKRRWHQPPPHKSRRERIRADPAGVRYANELLPPVSGTFTTRCRLSASPATGLVGMQENAFLSDFFACVGFLPLTTHSHIRETMVNIMTSPAIQQPTGVQHDLDETDAFDTLSTGGDVSTSFAGNQLPMDPSTCIFWCAVALGALVKGCPSETVGSYTRLATDALGTFSGPPNTEVAKAWTILAHLYGFTGDGMKFQEYLELSSSFLDASIEEGLAGKLPLGFAEMVGHTETVSVCAGYAQPGAIRAFCAHQQDPPQLNAAADETGLYIYVIQVFKAFEQAVFANACEKSDTTREGSGDAQPREETGTSPRKDAALPSEDADAMAAGLRDFIPEFERLEEAVDRTAIRNGIGSLLINGALVFKKAHTGDVESTLERIARCVEVYERYPGLCRGLMNWCHIVHVLLAALVALVDSRANELYVRLRAAYNPSRPPDSLPAPPLEEWRGMSSFCEDFHCRSLEGVIGSGAFSMFSTPLDKERKDEEVDISLALDGQDNAAGALEAAIVPGEMGAAVLVGPCSSGDELETATGNQPAMPSPSTHQPWIESEMGPNVGVACVRSRCGLDASVDALDMGPEDEAGDGGVAAKNWLDVTHAMLGAIDGRYPACM